MPVSWQARGALSLFPLRCAHDASNKFNEVGSWLPGEEKSALLVVSVAAEFTGKDGLMEELKMGHHDVGTEPSFHAKGGGR